MLAYEQVAQQIAHALSSVSRDTAWRQYIKLLVGRASVEGIDLDDGEPERVFGGGARHEAPSVLESVSESAAASVHASAVAPGAPSSPASARAGVGLIDGHGRRIDYLRVSVTDRCDLRCTYCLPKDYKGAEIPANWLSHEEMARLVRLFVDNGVRKVRLTGGEPLTRGGVAGLAAAIAAMPGLSDLSLSTNGTRLARHARSLREAGVQRLNVSLDTLDAAGFQAITGRDCLADVLDGLRAAREAGFAPVKLNSVVHAATPEDDVERLLAYAREQGFVLRLIEPMPMGDCGAPMSMST